MCTPIPMSPVYVLIVVGKRGMYTYGDAAATLDLARVAVGNLMRDTGAGPMRLGVERVEIEPGRRGDFDRRRTILVEAESKPGEWTIGVSA